MIRSSARPRSRRSSSSSCEHLRLGHHVERRRRLVGDHELGPAGQRERDHHALAHAARELVRVLVGARGADADALEQLARRARARRRSAPGSCRRIASPIWRSMRCTGSSAFSAPWKTSEIVAPAQVAHAALGVRRCTCIDAVRRLQVDRPARCRRRPGRQQLQQRERGRRLAAARLAGEPERLAAAQRRSETPVDDLDARAAVAVADAQVARRAGTGSRSRARPRRCGLAISSTTWPTAKNASTKQRDRRAPGGTTYHHAPWLIAPAWKPL